MKVLVFGYFGYLTNQIDGQTVKTREVYRILKYYSKDEVSFFDSQSFKKDKLSILKLILKLIMADTIFYLPASRSLKYLFPLIWVITKISRTKLNYLVVGGWVCHFLTDKPMHRYMLSKINGIYAETMDTCVKLKKYGFNNAQRLHNFRLIQYPELWVDNAPKDEFHLVFMARIHPLKGVDLLFELEERFKKTGLFNVCIDVYGPILESYEHEFYEKIASSTVNYRGVLRPENVCECLSQYDVMLFPTKYFTEGFPGTILDAYISGLPVIVSNWLNATEFVEHDKTGYIAEFGDNEKFIDETLKLIKNPETLLRLKKNVMEKRFEYSSYKAWCILERAIS